MFDNLRIGSIELGPFPIMTKRAGADREEICSAYTELGRGEAVARGCSWHREIHLQERP
jgi:hypothetical protein